MQITRRQVRRFGVITLAACLGFTLLLDSQTATSKHRSMTVTNTHRSTSASDHRSTSVSDHRSMWTFHQQMSNEAWELTPKEDEGSGRPIMHTFYEPTAQWTGMNLEGEAKLLEIWKEAWENKGWDTKVLSRDDAMKHPDFNMLEKRLQSLKVGPYNRVCFYRWLAMAAIDGDGGWISDYDLFPLSLSAERGRKIEQGDDKSFKSFSLHVPCLMHSSQDDWNRVIHLMIDDLPENNDGYLLISDMLTLRDIDHSEGMSMSQEVLKHFPYKTNDEGDLELECAEDQFLAVHLSPYECSEAFRHGRYPIIADDIIDGSDAVLNRADAAAKLMSDYNDSCVATTA